MTPHKIPGVQIHDKPDVWPNFPKNTRFFHSEIPGDETSDSVMTDIFKARGQSDLWIVEHNKHSWARTPGGADVKPLLSLGFKRPNIVGEERAHRLANILELIIHIQETRND